MCSKFRVCSRLLPDVVEVTRYRLFDDHAIVRNACLCAGFWTPGFGGADSHPPNILALPGAASGPSNSPAFKPALLTLSQPHPPVKTPPCAGKQSFADYASVLQSGSYSSKKPGVSCDEGMQPTRYAVEMVRHFAFRLIRLMRGNSAKDRFVLAEGSLGPRFGRGRSLSYG
jgi:hypothetical protein